MSKINLLPWREERKKAQNLSYYVQLGGVVGLSIVAVILIDMYLSHRINVENANISYIKDALKDIRSEVVEVQGLQQDKKQLYTRMSVIQLLAVDRTSIVRLFDAIPAVLPENIYLTEMSRKEITEEQTNHNLETSLTKSNSQENEKNNTDLAVVTPKGYLVYLEGVSLTNGSISVLMKNLENIKWITDLKLNEVAINKDGVGLNFKITFTQSLIIGSD